MTMHWSDERLDAALRELLEVRAAEIDAAARPVDEVSAQLADQLGVAVGTGRRSWRRAWRNNFMSSPFKIAAAGAALAIAVLVGLYLSQPAGIIGPQAPSPTPEPTLPPTPVEIAQAYIEARNAYDSERALELVADDFLTTEPDEGFRDLGSLELAFEKHKAFGFHHSDGDCREQPARGELAVVTCNYLWTTEVHRIRDYPPTPAQFRFSIRNGRIALILHNASFDFYFGPGSFSQFLSGHREYRELLDDTHELDPEEAREVIERLPEYFELYEEWLSSPDSTANAPPIPVSGIGAFQPGAHVMSTPREAHTATLLPDGRVLVTGGSTEIRQFVLDSVETFDHSTGDFTPTGLMTESRAEHTATLLADGRVLVTGGWGGEGVDRASAEIYDPQSGTFAPVGSMDTARRRHTATLLPDGRVLIAGGRPLTHTAELYDPGSGTFAPTGSMEVTRQRHTATLLPDGRVLIAGGWGTASAELYDPASGTFSATGSMGGRRGGHSATLLADGRVLLVGGCSVVHENPFVCGDFPDALVTAEMYDPASGTFAPTGSLASGRYQPSATLLADGRVFVAGGVGGLPGNTAEIYDPDNGAFAYAAPMGAVRIGHTATLLPDGRVLIAGGESTSQSTLESVELYTP